MQKEVPHELMVRYLSNQATEQERLALEQWLAQDPFHQLEFDRARAAWNTQMPRPFFDATKALTKLNARIDQHEAQAKPRVSTRIYWRVAASIVLAVSFGLLAFYGVGILTHAETEASFREVATLSGQKQRLRLTDGTVIRLNSNSRLQLPTVFSEGSREVTLEGEAYFEVAKDSLHPFIIHTGGIQTRVLGTAFNVKSTELFLQVAVAEGKVAVADSLSYFELLPNERVTYLKKEQDWKKEKTDLERELAWQRNKLIFENQSISDVVRVLSDWYGVRFTIENEAIGSCRITGTFTNETLENVLKAMSYSLDIQYLIKNKEVILTGKGC